MDELIKNSTATNEKALADVGQLPISTKAKEALQKIVEINNDYTLSSNGQVEKIEKIFDALPPNLQNEVIRGLGMLDICEFLCLDCM